MEERIYKKLEIENGELMPPVYRNFSGVPFGMSSGSGGRRTFCVRLDRGDILYGGEPLNIQDLIDDRWKVKFRQPRDEGDEPTPYLEVVVNFETSSRPPRIVVETSRNRVLYDEEMVSELDSAEIVSCEIIVNPYNNNVGTTTAYLQALYVTIEEDRFASKHPID